MKTLKLALVLLALAIFTGAAMTAATAATSTPTKMPTTVAAPKKMTGLGDMLKGFGSKSTGAVNGASSNAVKSKADKMTKDIEKKIAQSAGKTSTRTSLPALGSIKPMLSQFGKMPSLSSKGTSALTAPGKASKKIGQTL